MAAIKTYTAILETNLVTAAADAFAEYDDALDYALFHQGRTDFPIRFMIADAVPTAETSGWIDITKNMPMVATAEPGGTLYFLSTTKQQIGIAVSE